MEFVPRRTKKHLVSFRVNIDVLTEFKRLCRRYNIKQVAIIERVMKETIEELGDK